MIVDVTHNGEIVGSYPIQMDWMNASPATRADYVKEALRTAIEDGVLTETEAASAEFVVRRAPT